MRAKNYAISTDNLQSRYCYWRRQEHCAHSASPACTTNNSWHAEECLVTYADYCQAAHNNWTWPGTGTATTEVTEARTWLQNNNPPVGDANYGSNRQSGSVHVCADRNADDGNFSPNWLGRFCNKNAGEEAYIDCILDYPKGVIEKMLSNGAKEFPEVQFDNIFSITPFG
jgi:hypothetical protein